MTRARGNRHAAQQDLGGPTTHPELQSEQAYISFAYDCLDTRRCGAIALDPTNAADPFAAEALRATREAQIAVLGEDERPLCFGRIDLKNAETIYIGRFGVKDPSSGERVVINWKATVAAAFYQANQADTMGLRRRRQFTAEGRRLLDIHDDVFALAPAETATEVPLSGGRQDALLADLARSRTGELRDIVGTIQAEQDRLIRAPLEGVLVIQGGPGTGKTVVGLHRVALLLYSHRADLQRSGVLIVGPNRAFMHYVSRVLPSLGESSVTHQAIHDLSPRQRILGKDSPEVERLKGDQRMAPLIQSALTKRVRMLRQEEKFSRQGIPYILYPDVVNKLVDGILSSHIPHATGRERLRERLLTHLCERYTTASKEHGQEKPADYETLSKELRSAPRFQSVLDRVWPTLSAAELVSGLLAGRLRMQHAADGLLTEREQKILMREPAKNLAEERWTQTDMPLLDEAEALLNGSVRSYGHIVVDEAQDLSPMQIRMIARRSRRGSLTILGDLAQSTSAWAHESWDDILAHLDTPAGARVDVLSIGYRVPKQLMDFAAQLLPEAAPNVLPPDSVRPGNSPQITRVEAEDRLVDRLIEELASSSAGLASSRAVIAPRALLSTVRLALEAHGIDFAGASPDGFDASVVLLTAGEAKGLEFDAVFVLEPPRIVEEDAHGLRLLYVALTRSIRDLSVLHWRELPEALRQPISPKPEPFPVPLPEENMVSLLQALFFTGACSHNLSLENCDRCSTLLGTHGVATTEDILGKGLCFHLRAAVCCADCNNLFERYGDEIYSAVEESDPVRLARVATMIRSDAPVSPDAEVQALVTEKQSVVSDVSQKEERPEQVGPEPTVPTINEEIHPEPFEVHLKTLDLLIEELTRLRGAVLAGLPLEDLRLPRLEPPAGARSDLERLAHVWPAIFEYTDEGAVFLCAGVGAGDIPTPVKAMPFLNRLVEEARRVQPAGGRLIISGTGAFIAETDKKFVSFASPIPRDP